MISADDYEKELNPMIYNWVEQLSIPRFFFSTWRAYFIDFLD